MTKGWEIGGPSPFVTERARMRAPQVLDYVGAAGMAALVAPSGDIALLRGADLDLDLVRVVRIASRMGGHDHLASFAFDGACVHAAPVHHQWMLCVVSRAAVAPLATAERLKRAAHVLAFALVDGATSGGSGPQGGGAPAEISIPMPRRRN